MAVQASEERFEGKGGLRIFLRSWRPEKPRGVLAICHGFNAHSGQYEWVAQQFAANGFAVYAPDLRGRGQSDGERFFVEDISEYVSDLAGAIKIAKEREPDLPVFLLGHSAGGVTACTYTLDNQSELAGFICEDFAFEVPAPDFAIAVLKGLSHLAPHAHVLKLPNEAFSRDAAWVKSMNEDPLIAHEVQPTRTVAALARADDRLKRDFPTITIPLLILHGKGDKATKWQGSQFFYDAAGSKDKTLKLYDGAFHDLLADTIKQEVLGDIKTWVEAHMK